MVGGFAVLLHGLARTTGDIDLVVDLAPEPLQRTVAALAGAGFAPALPVRAEDFLDPATRRAWREDRGMLVFSWRPAHGVLLVDLFIEYPMPFEALWARGEVRSVRGLPVRVASLEDLIALKRASGREQDRGDLEFLERRLRERGGTA